MQLTEDVYLRKVMGCWLGKAVGGTLGMPNEGKDGPFDLTFYDPVPTQSVPNDDLDLQVLWAYVLDKMDSPRVDRDILASAWVKHVGFPWDEYGVAIRNIKLGLRPPLTGSYDNYFANSMGAAIRTEIWACLAPCDAKLATAYAYEDACVDHAKEGVWATIFLTALEAEAFGESDPDKLLDAAITYLPDESLVKQCVQDTRSWFASMKCWKTVRGKILEKYEDENFSDVVQNMGFTVLGYLAGEGDFGRAICIAANCGKDTDCTAATVGALMGIIDPDCIDEKWLAPIGRKLIVSEPITGITYPETIDGFTSLVADLRRRLAGRKPQPAELQPMSALDKFRITATRVFVNDSHAAEVDWNDAIEKLEKSGTTVVLPGAMVELSADEFEDDIMVLKYDFNLDEAGDVRVVFNCSGKCRVWVDGEFAFSRDAGHMAPSAHRCPENQYIDMKMKKGPHELMAAVYKPDSKKSVLWVYHLADGKTHQWIV